MASWSAYRGIRLRELEKKQAFSGPPGLDFSLDPASLERLTYAFARFPGALAAALLKATDRTRVFTRNAIVRGFAGILTLKPAYIGRGVKSGKARPVSGGAEAEIRVATRNIPLGRYAVEPETPPLLRGVPVRARKRISYTLRLGGPQHDDRPHDAPSGAGRLFVQRMPSGHVGVFHREGKSLVQEWAPSLQYYAHAKNFLDEVGRLSVARFRAVVVEEARKITGISGGGA